MDSRFSAGPQPTHSGLEAARVGHYHLRSGRPRCAPILLDVKTQFKFASTCQSLLILNHRRCPRGNSGKFITVYPQNDALLCDLAARLHQATFGMVGPTILSDAPYLKGSLVHYRYGAFDGTPRLTNDGTYSNCIVYTDGNPVRHRRLATFAPPPWVVSPIVHPRPVSDQENLAPRSNVRSVGSAVTLHDRYDVSVAIPHIPTLGSLPGTRSNYRCGCDSQGSSPPCGN